MLQLMRIIENGQCARDYQRIGPEFSTEAALRNYVHATTPTSQWWEMAVFTYGNDDEVYGGAELLESEDLQEWLQSAFWGMAAENDEATA